MQVEVIRAIHDDHFSTRQGTRSKAAGISLPDPAIGTAVLVDSEEIVAVVGHSERITVDVFENKNHPEFGKLFKKLAFVCSLSNLVGRRNAGGDFVLVTNRLESVGIERKSWPDLIHSFRGNRLRLMGDRLQEHYDYAFLIIDGDMPQTNWKGQYRLPNTNRYTRITDTQVAGILRTLQAECGLIVLWYGSVARTAVGLLKLWEAAHSTRGLLTRAADVCQEPSCMGGRGTREVLTTSNASKRLLLPTPYGLETEAHHDGNLQQGHGAAAKAGAKVPLSPAGRPTASRGARLLGTPRGGVARGAKQGDGRSVRLGRPSDQHTSAQSRPLPSKAGSGKAVADPSTRAHTRGHSHHVRPTLDGSTSSSRASNRRSTAHKRD